MTAALSISDLRRFGAGEDLGSQARALLDQQMPAWEMLRASYENLQAVQTRTIDFGEFVFRVQYNPRRITSSAAKVDAKSIAERKCFLCPANLPPVQRGIQTQGEYLLLVNPFPIFPEHFTIPHVRHVPQLIGGAFEAMLGLAQDLQSRHTVFYNGPRCGASAPDHLHFQAGNKGFMPIDPEFDEVKRTLGRKLVETRHLTAHAVDERYLRPFVSLESSDRAALVDAFSGLHAAMRPVCPGDEEPMMNVLASYQSNAWRVVVFPRVKHRPSFFFAEGDEKILLSPASVDFGGVCITPIEKDFQRLTADHLRRMFAECCLTGQGFEALCADVAGRLGR